MGKKQKIEEGENNEGGGGVVVREIGLANPREMWMDGIEEHGQYY